jgi:hypothetical protein
MAGQHDGSGFRRRHHAEHGHNRTVEFRPFHKAASPSLGIWVVSRSNRGWVGVYFVRRQFLVLHAGTASTTCDARRFCPRQVRRHHRKVRRLYHPPLGLARSIGAVGLFRSPNLSSASPMIPVTGVDAGAGKAGLIQSSATCPAGLECRKVLFRHKVTAIPKVTCTSFPESQNASEFAGATLGSIVTSG